mgnify:FL=1
MSRRKPVDPGHSRRAIIRALGLGLPAVAAACTASNPPEPDTSRPGDPAPDSGPDSGRDTGSTADTGSPDTADPRTPDPTSPWDGMGAADTDTFPLGVQTGEPRPDALLAWTWSPKATAITWHIALWDGATWVVQPTQDATAGDDGYVHHDLLGLPADQPVAVQAEIDGVFSAVAWGRTAPAIDSRPEVFLSATSCLDQNHGEYPSLDEVQSLGPIDAMIWLGDTVYADGRSELYQYRALWRSQLGKDSFQRLLHNVPGIWTWDDHEVGNNWNPQTIDQGLLDIAVQAFHETVPLPDTVRSTRKLWRSLRFGQTVELFVLDCRGERNEGAGHYVSPEQLQWLMDGLAASECTWKVVATSVPITDMPVLWDALGAQLDRWDGFPTTQRAELLSHIRQLGLQGVFFVAGDLHQSTVSFVDPEGGDGDNLLEIMAGPGGSFLNPAARVIEGDQFVYKDADWSCARMSFHPGGTATLQVVHEHGGDLMLEMTIDTSGQVVSIEQERHPWDE